MKNKNSFLIIVILFFTVVCIFSLFIYKYNQSSKIEYTVEPGTVLQDANRNYLTIDDEAKLKIRWNDSYYLIYQDKKTSLGKNVIAYNTITGKMKLYGDFYQILDTGKVASFSGETILDNTTVSSFYKIGDREYLLVDKIITNEDRTIEGSNYLLVELDKLGNAKLSNNKLNLKTITPTVLVTSEYTFDIANEILNFGKNDIDLKKIIGSTNEYKPEEKKPDNKEDDNSQNNGQGTGNGIGTGEGTGNGDVINNNDDGDIKDVEEIIKKLKTTSIVRTVASLGQIDVDYVVYDPNYEYKSVYVEVTGAGKTEVVYLSKTDTHMTINDLNPDTEYILNFVYTTADKDTTELIPFTFEKLTVKTLMPEYSVAVYKISKVYNTLTYKVYLQENYSINKVNVSLEFSYDEVDPETGNSTTKNAKLNSSTAANGSEKYVYGTFDISSYTIDEDSLLKLMVTSVENSTGTLNINSSSTFRFGR